VGETIPKFAFLCFCLLAVVFLAFFVAFAWRFTIVQHPHSPLPKIQLDSEAQAESRKKPLGGHNLVNSSILGGRPYHHPIMTINVSMRQQLCIEENKEEKKNRPPKRNDAPTKRNYQ
jgi:hypothetical protein